MKRLVVIGNSAAGIAAVEAIRRKDKASRITVVSDENHLAYCRCLISYYLAGDIKREKVFYRGKDFYEGNNIELLLNKKVSGVDPEKNRILCADKTQIGYDALLIAAGASAKLPRGIEGVEGKAVFAFRSLQDADEIEKSLAGANSVCILGAGLIGIKAAYALIRRGIKVKLVVKSGQILSQILDAESAAFLQRKLETQGMEIILGCDAADIRGDKGGKEVKLDSGESFVSSLVIVGKGVSPNKELAADTEIKTREGIIADDFMRTNIPDIYAAGDVREGLDSATGKTSINALWPVAVEQGRIAGLNMAGCHIQYRGSVRMNSIEFFGLPVISLGIHKINRDQPATEEIKISCPQKNLYKKLMIKDGVVVGAILIGNIAASGIYLRLIKEKIDISGFKNRLLGENFGYPEIMGLLPQEEHIYV